MHSDTSLYKIHYFNFLILLYKNKIKIINNNRTILFLQSYSICDQNFIGYVSYNECGTCAKN
ncbi:PEK protein kinase [Thermoanaerobacterium thermosaccharolyticum]|uniref:PEK protein kinase n=1 Tax=Thermoanaerobacterium thermosaccharolyticum TaxID=1517 RepID=A0A223I182_THETR|nr:PEK protein kinase [Thermoanaerobacterium thermosaccharolyticum]